MSLVKAAISQLPEKGDHNKIVIGYISNDFRNHPVAHQITYMLGLHDRERFVVNCYSYGRDDNSEYRRMVRENVDTFVDIQEYSHQAAAEAIIADNVNILVDLTGHTKGSRMQIHALCPAPVQVNFLGFPGSSGATFFDYFISDRTVTPVGFKKYFSEKLVYMPHCYMVTDNSPVEQPLCFWGSFLLSIDNGQ